MWQALQVLAVLPLVLVRAARRLERQVIARMTDDGATTPDRAMRPEFSSRLLPLVRRRLEGAGVLIRCVNDRYYFDAESYRRLARSRRRRALAVATLLLAGGAWLYLRGEW